MSLVGINTTDNSVYRYIVYNPELNEEDLTGDIKIQSNTFKVGKVTSEGETLATAHFNELHIGGGFKGDIGGYQGDGTGGLTITSNGNVYTNGTIFQEQQQSGRLAAPSMMQRTLEETFKSDTIEYNKNLKHHIVISTGTDIKVDLCNTYQDKRVFGVISEQSSNDLSVDFTGEGYIWVCNSGGNFEVGDYITTSTIPGIGIKQASDTMMNYTVAKIKQKCDFTSNVRYEKQNDKHTITLVKCMYTCG